jgi:hypothetical protein
VVDADKPTIPLGFDDNDCVGLKNIDGPLH